MRSLIGAVVAAICFAMIIAGLFFTVDLSEEAVVLDRPGKVGRLSGHATSATAFYEMDEDGLELTMLLHVNDAPNDIFRSRVRLLDGQSHSVMLDASDEGVDEQQYVFRRNGQKVRMILASAPLLTASITGTQ